MMQADFRLILPRDASARLQAFHPRYAGPIFSVRADDRTIEPVALEDTGGIAGTVIDAATGRPVEGAQVSAQAIEAARRLLRAGSGLAISDASGRFQIGGLAPGVYNLLLDGSPRGERFTARAIEGVRVRAGFDAAADLKLVAGRRIHGTATDARTRKPLAAAPIRCYSAARPGSGTAWHSTQTDDHGHFELFVPDGPARVLIGMPGSVGYLREVTLTVPADRDPEPIQVAIDDQRPAVLDWPFRPVDCDVRVRLRADAGEGRPPGRGSDPERTGLRQQRLPVRRPAVVLHQGQRSRRLHHGSTGRVPIQGPTAGSAPDPVAQAGSTESGSPSSHPRPSRWT